MGRGRACGWMWGLVLSGAILPWGETLRAEGTAPAVALHERIDRAIEAALEGQAPGALATDAEFARRLWLDLAGRVPTAEEARGFLDDPSPYKRERLIEALLASPTFARRMRDVFDTMWMERRDDKSVPSPAWREYLRRAFAEDRPYDELAREVLSADGIDPRTRSAAKFVLDREAEPNLLTRDLGRMFLGRDMQCAQCHDHPLIDDYKQAHYYGLFAFVSRTSLFNEPGVGNVLAEKGEGDVTYSSVFKKGITHATGPRVLDAAGLDEPAVTKGAEYLVTPGEKQRAVPLYSRRARLAAALAGGSVPEFDRNIANRLWALVMGRGIVDPVDLHHEGNPASHPELLDELARAFRDSKYDVRGFLRELVLSRTYQRSSEAPPGASADLSDPARFAVAGLKPLSPEQMAWSVMQALGIVEAYRNEAVGRLETLDPRMRDILKTDAKRQALRGELIEAYLDERLGSSVAPFTQRFAAAAGQPQGGAQASVHQALFLSNADPVHGWLQPSGVNLTSRLDKLADPAALADELYLSVLTRRPSAEERQEVAAYLASRPNARVPAIQELIWSLLASVEFRFNH